MDIRSTAEVRRSLIPWGFDIEYRLTVTCEPLLFPDIVDSCINQLLPAALLHGGVARDFKGREPGTVLLPGTLPPAEEEVFFISGRVLPDEGEPDENGSAEAGEAFQLQLLTAFREFSGAAHIHYAVQERRRGPLPESVPLRAVGRAFPLVLEQLRIGLELFQSRFITASLGFAPVAAQRLLIDANRTELSLLAAAEGLRRRSDRPLAQEGLNERLGRIFERLFMFDLWTDYKAKTE